MSERKVEAGENLCPEHKRYRLLLQITDVVARAESLSDAFNEFAPPLLALTGSELLNLSLQDPHRKCMRHQYWKKNSEKGEFEGGSLEDAATGWDWKHPGESELLQNTHDRVQGCIPELINRGILSYTVRPMNSHSGRFGSIGLGKSVAESLHADDVDLLSRVALIGAFRLERDRASRALEEQNSLVEMGRELGSSIELENLLPAILSNLRGIARYGKAMLALFDEDGKSLELCENKLDSISSVNYGAPLLEGALFGQAIRTRNPVFFGAEDLRDLNEPIAQFMYQSGIRSVCSVPLVAGRRAWGVLNASASIFKAFGPAEAAYLQHVATLISTALQNANAYRQVRELTNQLERPKRDRETAESRNDYEPFDIVGKNAGLRDVLDQAATVADTDSTVLITGETGTGKECVARAIHNMSRRRDRGFFKVNCAAIPTGLLESELFGHEKGAFTGAVSQKVGRLELADHGTLLLDEIGDIPLELQPKLLRVLQEQEFERLGGTRTIRVDVRLIAATNRDLSQAIAAKEFRDDLYYRLRVFPLHLPPLRDRRDDMPLLIQHFVEKSAARLHKTIEVIPDEVVRALMDWKWPGNIRELENFIERSVILSPGTRLNAPLAELREIAPPALEEASGTLHDREREHIIEILRQTRGTLSGPSGAAARLGLKRTTLQYKMQRLGISREDFLH